MIRLLVLDSQYRASLLRAILVLRDAFSNCRGGVRASAQTPRLETGGSLVK
jgi:hypothetical protein